MAVRVLRSVGSLVGTVVVATMLVTALIFGSNLSTGAGSATDSASPVPVSDARGGLPASASPQIAPADAGLSTDVEPLAPPDPPKKCEGAFTILDRVQLPIGQEASVGTATLVVTVDKVGGAGWRTENGSPPEVGDAGLRADHVMRLIHVQVEEVIRGEAPGTAFRAWILGGAMGCAKFVYDEVPLEIVPGDRFVLVIDGRYGPVNSLAGVPQVLRIWPIDGTNVQVPAGPTDIEELKSAIAADGP